MEGLGGQIIFYVVFLVSVTLHEASHAWAALRGGDETAYLGGQVSIDPLPHIQREPFGMVILPIISLALLGWPFGYASTPFDPRWAEAYPRRAGAMALAGPGANLALVLVAGIVLKIGLATGLATTPDRVGFFQLAGETGSSASMVLVSLCSLFFSMNLLLAILNLIPVPPLDGSAAMGLFLPPDLLHRWKRLLQTPGVALLGILVAWRLLDHVFWPVFLFLAGVLHAGGAAGRPMG